MNLNMCLGLIFVSTYRITPAEASTTEIPEEATSSVDGASAGSLPQQESSDRRCALQKEKPESEFMVAVASG